MSIISNKKAFFNYFIEERYEAGLVLEGWEVKGIQASRGQIDGSYIVIKNKELFLIGAHISPLKETSTYLNPDPTRIRKLLLHGDEIKKLIRKVEQRGYTLIPLNFHYKSRRIKCEIGLAKGKKLQDKRETEKKRDWEREKARITKISHSYAV
ncbi:MAG: SsrA-binding protein SmpB [Burkholderia sp.]|nr:SsrA-binding protein SmpB [Burkholderia sp.]